MIVRDTELIRTPNSRPPLIAVVVAVAVVVFVAALFYWVGYGIGAAHGSERAAVVACSEWCTAHVENLTRDEYLGCLSRCERWGLDD